MTIWESDDIRIWFADGDWHILYKHLKQIDSFEMDMEEVISLIRYEVGIYD